MSGSGAPVPKQLRPMTEKTSVMGLFLRARIRYNEEKPPLKENSMISPEEFAKALGLTVISGTRRQHGMRIRVADLCRPGLQFAGYFDVFASERPQLIGKTEMPT